MGRAFNWLPFVDNCCACVIDMRIATYLVAIYTIIKSLIYIMVLVLPICTNLRGQSGIGFTVYVVDMIYLGITMILLFVALLMFFTTMMNKPLVKPFIIVIYIDIVFFLFAWVVYIIRMRDVDMKCIRENYGDAKTNKVNPLHMFLQLFFELVLSAIFAYFTIVVNSFAMLWDRFGGNIPPPQLPRTVIIIPPPDPGQGGQRNVHQDYPGAEDPRQPKRPGARKGFMTQKPTRQEPEKEQTKPAQEMNAKLQEKALQLCPQVNVKNVPPQELQEKSRGFLKLGSTRLKRSPKKTHEQRKTMQQNLQLKKSTEDGDHKPANISLAQKLQEQAFLLQGFLPNLPPTIQSSPIKPLSQLAYLILNSTLKKQSQERSPEPIEPQLSLRNAETGQASSERELPKQDSPNHKSSQATLPNQSERHPTL